ncbi:MAG: hypothetical protein IT176_12130 [Acidobacteria bacterium]|nr:hypothetical protein [Acidobacteriota bacterium]
MIRRLISVAALMGCAVASVAVLAAAPEHATFILTTGERKSGPVVFHGARSENLIDGYLNLGVEGGGPEYTVPVEQVAVIDFVGGQPSAAELDQVSASGQSIALRDGKVEQGKFVNILRGDTVRWQDQNGSTHDIPVSQVSRIYLNPPSAFAAFNYTPANRAAVGTAGSQTAQPGVVQVMANQPWTSTNVIVQRGDRVMFRTTGQIKFGTGASQVAPADGNDSVWNPAFPVRAMPVGGLIGRVGNSAPFPIGSNRQWITMPATGMLMLGVNDNELNDNSGYFSVDVIKR